MRITRDEMAQAMPIAQMAGRIDQWYAPLTEAMGRHAIDNAARTAAFLANVAEETNELQAKVENLNYSGDRLAFIFPSLFANNPDKAHDLCAAGPEAVANYIYDDANRPHTAALGNTLPGDGWKYRGRGPMQFTGKDNYVRFFRAAGLPDDTDPDRLLEPTLGAESAAWIWERDGCNTLADMGRFYACVLRMNGGDTNLKTRLKYYQAFLNAMGEPSFYYKAAA